MKNLLFLFVCLMFVIVTNAQESTTYDSKLGYTESYKLYDGIATDVLKVGDSTWTYTVWKESYNPLKFDAFVKLDSIGGTSNVVTLKIQGKKFLDQPSWTDLKSVSWTTGKDTTKLLTESTTAQQYRYYRLFIQGANDTFLAKILLFYIKFWE